MYLTFAVGELFEDISGLVSRVIWRDDVDPDGVPGSLLTITFDDTPEARAAQMLLAGIEEPVSFIYGAEGKAPGAVRLRGELVIHPSHSDRIVIASSPVPLEQGWFGC